jgi:hypothetical protein
MVRLLFLLSLLSGVVLYFVANKPGEDRTLWGALGFILGPLALIVLMIARKRRGMR